MQKKKSKSMNPGETKKLKIIKPKPAVTEEGGEENPLTFGGIPNRDLKKNLGCG